MQDIVRELDAMTANLTLIIYELEHTALTKERQVILMTKLSEERIRLNKIFVALSNLH
jgi:hypothetical protein